LLLVSCIFLAIVPVVDYLALPFDCVIKRVKPTNQSSLAVLKRIQVPVFTLPVIYNSESHIILLHLFWLSLTLTYTNRNTQGQPLIFFIVGRIGRIDGCVTLVCEKCPHVVMLVMLSCRLSNEEN